MLPGGRIARRQDPIAAAQREMRQELGVAAQRWQVIGCLAARKRYRRRTSREGFRRHSTFYVRAEVSVPPLEPRLGELSDAKWFYIDALPEDRSDSLDVAAHAGFLTDGAGGQRTTT
jgi:8-oxo-dGTP pyrophosphatase MutT (NUDIX family)